MNLRFFGWDVSAEGGEEAAAERCHSSTSRPSGAKQSGHFFVIFSYSLYLYFIFFQLLYIALVAQFQKLKADIYL